LLTFDPVFKVLDGEENGKGGLQVGEVGKSSGGGVGSVGGE
jgi:hypothetical protein